MIYFATPSYCSYGAGGNTVFALKWARLIVGPFRWLELNGRNHTANQNSCAIDRACKMTVFCEHSEAGCFSQVD
jgi:hypothetical protein